MKSGSLSSLACCVVFCASVMSAIGKNLNVPGAVSRKRDKLCSVFQLCSKIRFCSLPFGRIRRRHRSTATSEEGALCATRQCTATAAKSSSTTLAAATTRTTPTVRFSLGVRIRAHDTNRRAVTARNRRSKNRRVFFLYGKFHVSDRLPPECRLADCSFLHSNSCYEHKLITACCCTNYLI